MTPTPEVMQTMRPWRRRSMPRRPARVRRNAAVRFRSRTACQSSSFMRSARLSRVMPALLTRMSSRPPSAASASRTSWSAASGSARLATSEWARSPSLAASDSSAGARVPASATSAPWACSARAMAPPMPPEAPVTSAVWPVRSNMLLSSDHFSGSPCPACPGHPRLSYTTRGSRRGWPGQARARGGIWAKSQPLDQGFDLGGGADRDGGERLVDALRETGEDSAGAEFDDLLDLVLGEEEHGFPPTDHMRDLLDQKLLDFLGLAGRPSADIGDERHGGGVKRGLGQRLGHDLGGGRHQWRVERRRHRQHDRAAGAALGGDGDGALDRLRVTAEHDLARGVVVRDRADLALRSGLGDLARSLNLKTEERRHRALADRHRLLHRLAAALDEPRRVGHREGAGGGQRRIFAEGMAGDIGGALDHVEAG